MQTVNYLFKSEKIDLNSTHLSDDIAENLIIIKSKFSDHCYEQEFCA